MLDRVQLKYEAKAITKNARESAYVFTLIYLAIGLVLDGIDYLVSGSPQTEVYGYLADYMPEAAVYLRGTEPILHLPAPAVWFVSIVISLVTAVLGAGYILYTMNVRKGLITPYTTLFDGFLFAGKIILLEIVQYIFVFLWSLLFIIPGIIAGYRYRFALYNLCENPEMGVMEALNKEATYGLADEMDKHIAGMAATREAVKYASSATSITKSNVLEEIDKALEKLYGNNVKPNGKIMMEVPPWFYMRLKQAYTALDTDNSKMLENGRVGKYGNVIVKMSNNVDVDSSANSLITVHTDKAVAFVNPMTHVEAYRPEKGFSDAVKGFVLYQAKIVRPKELVVLNCKAGV